MADIKMEVVGIVAQRNKLPYVQVSKNGELVVQFTIAEARSFALDLMRAASYAEADAMITRFFERMDFPDGALNALALEFRQFRHELDTEAVETTATSPDGLKGKSNA